MDQQQDEQPKQANKKREWNRFCRKCGQELVFTKPRTCGHNTDTGEPILERYATCPNYGSFKIGNLIRNLISDLPLLHSKIRYLQDEPGKWREIIYD